MNEAVAAAAHAAGILVMQDVGGKDRPISDALLSRECYPPHASVVQPHGAIAAVKYLMGRHQAYRRHHAV